MNLFFMTCVDLLFIPMWKEQVKKEHLEMCSETPNALHWHDVFHLRTSKCWIHTAQSGFGKKTEGICLWHRGQLTSLQTTDLTSHHTLDQINSRGPKGMAWGQFCHIPHPLPHSPTTSHSFMSLSIQAHIQISVWYMYCGPWVFSIKFPIFITFLLYFFFKKAAIHNPFLKLSWAFLEKF